MISCELVGALDSTGREMRLDDISGRAVQVTEQLSNQASNKSTKQSIKGGCETAYS